MRFTKYKYDVFISHAVEDKLPIANELCQRLEEAGLRVWYSGFELRPGDNIEETIRKGLRRCRYAVVIFSQKYLEKNWPMKEYYMSLAQEHEGRKVILPVLFDVTVDDLIRRDINMADKFCIPYSRGLDYVVSRLLEVIKGVKPLKKVNQPPTFLRRITTRMVVVAGILAGALAASYAGYSVYKKSAAPDEYFIQQQIDHRIDSQAGAIEKEVDRSIREHNQQPSTHQQLIKTFSDYERIKSYYRNEYEFSNGYRQIRGRKNVEHDLAINVDEHTPYHAYGFASSEITCSEPYHDGAVTCIAFSVVNKTPVTYKIMNTRLRESGDYEVTVQYTNNLRAARVTLIFPAQDFPKRYQVYFHGFLPTEKFIFSKKSGTWSWIALE